MAEKYKLEMEIKNQPPPKLKEDTVDEEKPPAGGYTVKINNYGRIAFPLLHSSYRAKINDVNGTEGISSAN